jgi:adenine-specific DNA-methyltransferase
MSYTKEQAKEGIEGLVKKYESFVKTGKANELTEEETKKDFILPLFRFLNWNVEDSNEVSAEEKISKKRVDYGFRINGIPKFFLEAKSIDTSLELDEMQQAVNYSYWKWTTWTVLTNFKRLQVYNALWKGSLVDKRLFDLSFDQYLEKFDYLWYLSKDSFLVKSIDRFAEDVSKKNRKTMVTPIMKELFIDMINWRGRLSKDILGFYVQNKTNAKILKGDKELLEECVQRIIDRLIFIRVLEDRDLEPNILMSSLQEWRYGKRNKTYMQVLTEKFKDFDDKYNSKLFSKHVADSLVIDDLVLGDIIFGLYKRGSIEYDFSAIDVDVLGNIYEEYLGYILKKGKEIQNVAHRKEMGIYYTPTYVVDFIVENTLEKFLKQNGNRDPKVLDMACGSGSFLIKAFDTLLKYHPNSNKVTFADKIRILKNNIYGVDLDPKAVEIAQLNLLLKSVESNLEKLPFLENIRVGNSLVDSKKVIGDRAFYWDKEFADIVDKNGFDVIIGNPPYVKEFVNRKIFEEVKEGSSRLAKYYEGKMDYLYFFIELGIDLLKEGGYLGFITTNYWLQAEGAKKLREKILKETSIVKVFNFNEFKVFAGTGQHNLIIILQKKQNPNNKINVSIVKNKDIPKDEIIFALKNESYQDGIETFVSQIQGEFVKNEDFKISFINESAEKLCKEIKKKQNYSLKENDVATGIDVHQDKVSKPHLEKMPNLTIGDGIFVLSDNELQRLGLNNKEKEIIKPFYTTENLGRYFADKNNKEWIIYTTTEVIKEIEKYPKIRKHLDKFHKIITSDFKPYGLHRAREEKFFLGEKIISLRKTMEPSFSLVDFPSYVSLTFFIIKPDDINLKYLIGLLNSKLMYFWLYHKGKKEGEQLQIDKAPIMDLPIRIPSKTEQEEVIELVEKELELNKEFQKSNPESDKGRKLLKEIKRLDSDIDSIIYKIYGLTNGEIKIIENA